MAMTAILDPTNGQLKMIFLCLWECQFSRKVLKFLLQQSQMRVILHAMSEMPGNQVLMLPPITSDQDQEVRPGQE